MGDRPNGDLTFGQKVLAVNITFLWPAWLCWWLIVGAFGRIVEVLALLALFMWDMPSGD